MTVTPNRSASEIRSELDDLALGEAAVSEARAAIRAAIGAGAPVVSEAYDALRTAAWRMIKARELPANVEAWHDLFGHAAALVRKVDRPDLAERLTALAELIAQSARFGDRQPLEEVLQRDHVAQLLTRLLSVDGFVPRAMLAEASGLANANLSRVLGILNAHGLIRRRRVGKEVEVALSDLGVAAATRLGGTAPANPAAARWWDYLREPAAAWDAAGAPIGCNDAFRNLLRDAVGGSGLIHYDEWQDWVGTLGRAGPGGGVIKLSGDRWLRPELAEAPDRSRQLRLIDVSAECREIETLDARLRDKEVAVAVAREEVAKAKAEAEAARRELLAFGNAFEMVRGAILEAEESTRREVTPWRAANATNREFSHYYTTTDRYLGSVQQLLSSFPDRTVGSEVARWTDTGGPIDKEDMARILGDFQLISGPLRFRATGKDWPVRRHTSVLRAVVVQSLVALSRRAGKGEGFVEVRSEGGVRVTLSERARTAGDARWHVEYPNELDFLSGQLASIAGMVRSEKKGDSWKFTIEVPDHEAAGGEDTTP